MHLFIGNSNTCKSYLAALTGKTVFETDSVVCMEDIPPALGEDIIVVGNRWTVDIEVIVGRLVGYPEVIKVEFSKGE